ncbi:hypothetical protein GUITHDRAFT_153821 [Guillardia theta CCMP2712]|uniref:Uncharacterized protein n=1 Tax=Guillardia theta (strain CCMP2712) TaxID=905079 RepID=L1IZ45_GUITC|nr:hypothetical protein GUITHDRAFT_153821 [Guillardia theta CCMP2712]EKX41516.1 hypothetical protein GUITHDRAFT_153821 [Guillardia theta CCMP2712]|eukprot:XP_005828496.1 hypothetical protein GUITHDRAFT_153821 [Guillardia theta CCMP2712]
MSPSLFLMLAASAMGGGRSDAAFDVGRFKSGNMAFPEPIHIQLPDLRKLERTFIEIGPLCIRSGHGLMLAGAGCGVGMGIGVGFPLTGAGGGFDSVAMSPLGRILSQLPGGYTMMDLLRKALRYFPSARVGGGCGIGCGYGVGVGIFSSGGSSIMPVREEQVDAMQELRTRLDALETRVEQLESRASETKSKK